MEKLIITAAVTGSITTKEQLAHLPITPEEIATAAVECYHAGATIVHIHVRDTVTGEPSLDLELYKEVRERINAQCDMIINLTTGAGSRTGASAEKRAEPISLKPEMCSLDIGSLNIGYDVSVNTLAMGEYWAKRMLEAGVKPEIEIFDAGQVDLAKRLINMGLIKEPPHFQFVMGVLGGIGATPKNLIHLRESIPSNATWSVLGIGSAEFPMVTMGIIMGGHVRVGFEDNLYASKGVMAKNNAQLVEKVITIAKHLDREIATAEEARSILSLGKGKG